MALSDNSPYLMPINATVKINSIATGQTDTTTTELNKNLTYNPNKSFADVMTRTANLMTALSTNTVDNVGISIEKNSADMVMSNNIGITDSQGNIVTYQNPITVNFTAVSTSGVTGVYEGTLIFGTTLPTEIRWFAYCFIIADSTVSTRAKDYAVKKVEFTPENYCTFTLVKWGTDTTIVYPRIKIFAGVNYVSTAIPIIPVIS